MTGLDRRLHAFRPDLADARLEGQVQAATFVQGVGASVVMPVADLRAAPDNAAGLETQLLLGDRATVFERRDGWVWVQAARDGYVGYARAEALGDSGPEPTHVVRVPRTFVYAGPDLKRVAVAALSLGCGVTVTGEAQTRGTRYALLDDGRAVVAAHLRQVEARGDDYVGVAETLERTPYLWGGASAFGIDCSGLVQLAMRMAGVDVPRDTDMQATAIGEAIDPGSGHSDLRRGDLVFWRGHVGIMRDTTAIVHASGHVMQVSIEPLDAAVERIGYLYGRPVAFRRP